MYLWVSLIFVVLILWWFNFLVIGIILSMAPRKKQKGVSSSTAKLEQEYDRTKFVSPVA